MPLEDLTDTIRKESKDMIQNIKNLNKNKYIVIHGLQDEIVDISNCYKFVDYCNKNNIYIKGYYVEGNHDSKVVAEGLKKSFEIIF